MQKAMLVRTSGPYSGRPDWEGIWSDPETEAEVLRMGYQYRMRSWGREWYVWTPSKFVKFQPLDEPSMACAFWQRIHL